MTLGSHQRTIGKSQSHFTPRHIIDALGPFDLDPCAGHPRPWDCARTSYSVNGLDYIWRGRVWLNPPFHRYEVPLWISKLSIHRNGIALVHARTETLWFEYIWRRATSILFLADRLCFCDSAGIPQPHNSGAPAVLASFDEPNAHCLATCKLDGFLVTNWREKGSWELGASAVQAL